MSGRVPPTRRPGVLVATKLGSDVAGRLLLFALFALAARSLELADFGRYALALGVGLILAQLADAGLQLTLLRRLAAGTDAYDAGRALGTVLLARLAIALPLSLVGVLFAVSLGGSPLDIAAFLAIIGAAITLAFMDTLVQVFRSAERLDLEAAVGLFARGALAGMGIAALLIQPSLAGLALAHVLAAVMGVLLAGALAMRLVRPARPSGAADMVGALREGLPVAVAGAASLLMFRIDLVMLELLRGLVDVATYGAAFRLFEATLLLPVAAMALVFPRLVRAATQRADLGRLVRGVTVGLGGAGAAVTAAVWLLGGALVALLYGPDFGAANVPLTVLGAAVPAMYVNAVLTHALIAVGRAWWQAAAMGVALLANVALNVVLIPDHGPTGAAAASVVAEVALLIGCLMALRIATSARPARASS